jgi:hypothetical protein
MCVWEVQWLNIKPGTPRLSKISWGSFDDDLQNTDLNDPERREKMQPTKDGSIDIQFARQFAECVRANADRSAPDCIADRLCPFVLRLCHKRSDIAVPYAFQIRRALIAKQLAPAFSASASRLVQRLQHYATRVVVP